MELQLQTRLIGFGCNEKNISLGTGCLCSGNEGNCGDVTSLECI